MTVDYIVAGCNRTDYGLGNCCAIRTAAFLEISYRISDQVQSSRRVKFVSIFHRYSSLLRILDVQIIFVFFRYWILHSIKQKCDSEFFMFIHITMTVFNTARVKPREIAGPSIFFYSIIILDLYINFINIFYLFATKCK